MIDLDRVARICFYILTGGTLVLASHMMTMRYALARLNSPDSLAYCIQMVEEMKRDN